MGRKEYFLKRFVLSIPVLIFGVSITFIVIRAGPLNPAAAILGPNADQNAYRQIERQLGLNRPLWVQYIDYMYKMFTFDLGQSWVIKRNASAYDLILTYAPRTLWLGFWSILVALFIGIPLGFTAGLNPNTWRDYLASFGGIVWRAMPTFWLAVIVLSLLTQSEELFGFTWETVLIQTDSIIGSPPLDNLTNPQKLLVAIKKILPPALVLGAASMGNEMRIGRTAVLETVNKNYIETARAKGVPSRKIVWKHIFRNALIPLIPIITGEAFILVGGSVLVETVFNINGLGWLFFKAIVGGDLPLVGALMFIYILFIVGLNIIQDLLYTLVDPRVGYEGGT